MGLDLQGFRSLASGAKAEVLVSKSQAFEQGGALAPRGVQNASLEVEIPSGEPKSGPSATQERPRAVGARPRSSQEPHARAA